MSINTVPQPPYSPDLAACDFWLFPKLRGCRYERIEEMKEAVTKVIDTLTQKDFHGTFQKLFGTVQVHCSRRRLLGRGVEFHVCTINKSAYTKKSLETYLMILVPSINLNLPSSVLHIQVFQNRNIYSHFVDGVDIWWLVRRFLVSSTWTLFFLPRPTFFLGFIRCDLFFQKSGHLGLWDTPWWRLSLSPCIQL